jgi:hypothetical protein
MIIKSFVQHICKIINFVKNFENFIYREYMEKSELIDKISKLGIQTINHQPINVDIDLLINKTNDDIDIDIDIGNIDIEDYDYYHNLIMPPHEIPLYRHMISLYLGIGSYVMKEKGKIDDLNTIIYTHYGKDNDKDTHIPNPNITLKLILITDCWNEGCINKKIYFFEDTKHNDLIIFFNIGIVVVNNPINVDKLQEWLTDEDVNKTIFNKKYRKIYLFGHSNGMVSSTLLSYYLMLCVKYELSEDFYIPENDITNKINICGTAGFPEIFEDEESFIEYYNFYKGRYLHICSGLNYNIKDEYLKMDNDINKKICNIIGTNSFFYVDKYISNQISNDIIFKNYKIYLYYETSNDIKSLFLNKNESYGGIILNEKLISSEKNIHLYNNRITFKNMPILESISNDIHKFIYYRSLLKSYFL